MFNREIRYDMFYRKSVDSNGFALINTLMFNQRELRDDICNINPEVAICLLQKHANQFN